MPIIIYNNTNSDNYTFDPDKIEFVGGVEKLKATAGTPEAYMYVTMDDNVSDDVFRDESGNSRDGALKGGLTGAVNKVPGKINNGLTGISPSDQGLVGFGKEDFQFERTDPFSYELWIKTTSSKVMALMSKQLDVVPFTGVTITTQATGKIRCVVRSASEILSREFNIATNDGIFHHVVMTYDGSSDINGLKLYIDNTQNDIIIASDTLTSTIIADVDFQISGRNGNNNCLDTDTIVDECVVYARELTAAEVAFRWNNGNGTQVLPGPGATFPTDNPASIPKAGFQATSLIDFDATITEPGSDTITFTIVVNGVEKYWDGLAWVDSSGYPQTNTLAEVSANISSLPLVGLASINHWRYFHSADGSTTPELDDTTFEYDIEPEEPIFTETIITGSLFDIGAVPPNTTITIRPVKYLYGTNSIITNIKISVSYISTTGDFEARIYVEDDIPDELIWKFGSKEVRTRYLSGNIKFSALPRVYT